MSTNTSPRTGEAGMSPAAGVDHVPGLLRKAGIAAVAAFLAMMVSPILVIGSNLTGGAGVYGITVHNDPVTWMHRNVEGVIYGLQGIAVAASVAVMVVCVLRALRSSLPAEIMVLAGTLPVVSWMIFGAATAQTYSTTLGGDIAQLQPDAAIRSTVGYAQVSMTQGLMGSAGIALAAWAVLLHYAGRPHGLTGRLYFSLVAVIGLATVAATALGVGGLAALLAGMPLMLVVAVTLLRRSRSTGPAS